MYTHIFFILFCLIHVHFSYAKLVRIEVSRGMTSLSQHIFYVDEQSTVHDLKMILGTSAFNFDGFDLHYADHITMHTILILENSDSICVYLNYEAQTPQRFRWIINFCTYCFKKSHICQKSSHKMCLRSLV